MSADVDGAPGVIVRAKAKDNKQLRISQKALNEVGMFVLCRSPLWVKKQITCSAWWVTGRSVKMADPETGGRGLVIVVAKKNFLPPIGGGMEMGFGIGFCVELEDGKANHVGDRRDYELEGDGGELALEDEELVVEEMAEQIVVKEVVEEEVVEEEVVEEEEIAEEEEEEEEEEEMKASPPSPPPPQELKKKGLSAHDRKMIKKYGSLEKAQEAKAKLAEQEKAAPLKKAKLPPPPSSASTSSSSSSTTKTTALSRGKKHKQKKMNRKYADQDDEDRNLAIKVLQGQGEKEKGKASSSSSSSSSSSNKNKHKNKPVPVQTQSQIDAETATKNLLVKDGAIAIAKLDVSVVTILSACAPSMESFDAYSLEGVAGLDSLEKQVKAAKRLLELSEKESASNSKKPMNFSASLSGIVRTIKQYGSIKGEVQPVEDDNDNEKDNLEEEIIQTPIDDSEEVITLTGKVHENDRILYAYPVCAPYASLSTYAFKIKLQVSERSERTLIKTRILAINPAIWLQTASSST